MATARTRQETLSRDRSSAVAYSQRAREEVMDKLLGRIGRTMLAVLSATITATALGSEPIAIEKSIFWGDLHTLSLIHI